MDIQIYHNLFPKLNNIKSVTGKVTTLPASDFHFYLLSKITFHNCLRRAQFEHKFLTLIKIFRIFRYELTEKNENYEKR